MFKTLHSEDLIQSKDAEDFTPVGDDKEIEKAHEAKSTSEAKKAKEVEVKATTSKINDDLEKAK